MIDKNKVSGAEMQCKVHRGAEVQKYVQMFSRGDCAGDYAGAETRCNMQRWCRECADAEVQMQRCRGAEVVQRSRCRAGVQSMCRGSEYLQGFRRGDCAGNCAEVPIWRCSNIHMQRCR
jgi:hypothetical protein